MASFFAIPFRGSRARMALLSGRHCRTSRRAFSSTVHRLDTWGFIGLGQMGYRMAKNLREKIPQDDKMIVQDVNAEATNSFVQEMSAFDVEVAQSARQVAEQSNTTITVLPKPSHVLSVYESILNAQLPKLGASNSSLRCFLDCSTIDPMTSSEVAKLVDKGQQGVFIDAPMSGGVVGAGAGTLTFMIGADAAHVDRATKILSMMGKKVLHMGAQGAGLKAKLANNYLLALNNLATCEAMSMGIQWGLDPEALAGLINISTGRCWPSEVNNPVPGVVPTSPASRDYEGGFGVSLMNKDLHLAMAAAQEHNVKVELGPVAEKVYTAVEDDPALRNKDFSVVYRWLGGPEKPKH